VAALVAGVPAAVTEVDADSVAEAATPRKATAPGGAGTVGRAVELGLTGSAVAITTICAGAIGRARGARLARGRIADAVVASIADPTVDRAYGAILAGVADPIAAAGTLTAIAGAGVAILALGCTA
jgi:hypothetical protein